jgi:rhodanese-related sulfurtransferase
VLVDIRSDSQRASDGLIPAAVFVARNVLEWRLDPSWEHRDPMLARRDHQVIVICNEGYQSSLAAANLRRLGLDASDVIGGFQAWREAGLPVAQPERTKRVRRGPRCRPSSGRRPAPAPQQTSQQASPRHASRPSRTATAAITSAVIGSAHHQPARALAPRPISSAVER